MVRMPREGTKKVQDEEPRKVCIDCKIELPISMFYKHVGGKYGVSTRCKKHEAIRLQIWRKKNPEKVKRQQDRGLDSRQSWAENNRHKSNEIKSSWARRNPELQRLRSNNYRARKLNAPGILSEDNIALLYLIFGKSCQRCGSEYLVEVDHVVPLSIGGSNYVWNLQPLCRSCNATKNNLSCADYRAMDRIMLLMQLIKKDFVRSDKEVV